MVVGDDHGTVRLLEDASATCIMEVNVGREITTLAVSPDAASPYIVCGTSGTADSHSTCIPADCCLLTDDSQP